MVQRPWVIEVRGNQVVVLAWAAEPAPQSQRGKARPAPAVIDVRGEAVS